MERCYVITTPISRDDYDYISIGTHAPVDDWDDGGWECSHCIGVTEWAYVVADNLPRGA